VRHDVTLDKAEIKHREMKRDYKDARRGWNTV
jgi:hypothetical protein